MSAADRRAALNMLLAIPIGFLGGALAANVILDVGYIPAIFQHFVFGAPSEFSSEDSILGILSSYGIVGGVIGVVSFPIAYATVGRTKNVFSVVPAGLVATVLGAWIGFELLSELSSRLPFLNNLGGGWFFIFILIPVIAMFGGCAWVAARERRRTARL